MRLADGCSSARQHRRRHGGCATTTPPPTRVPPSGDVAELAQQAEDAFNRAQAALQAGDFATYGDEIKQAQELIAALVRLTSQ